MATYLEGRIQDKPEMKPGRTPDMSAEAGAAMKAVLAEILFEQQTLHWERFNEALKVSPILIGAAGVHSLDARREAAYKMTTNHVKVSIICNPKPGPEP